jgi:hypothetical protein
MMVFDIFEPAVPEAGTPIFLKGKKVALLFTSYSMQNRRQFIHVKSPKKNRSAFTLSEKREPLGGGGFL